MIENEDSLQKRIAEYRQTSEHHDHLFRDFTRRTEACPLLRQHRKWVEEHRWGYGDRAFAYMWLLILREIASRFPENSALEIGVYKGQTISLWALLARELGVDLDITAVSPFEGNFQPAARWRHRFRWLLSPRYRREAAVGNLHPKDDYTACNREVFRAFGLDFADVRAICGRSQDAEVLAALQDESFSLVYIDGDHRYEAVLLDLQNYSPRVRPGGILVVDDASFFLPGTAFFKGFESVSSACEILPSLGLNPVLTIGHNRIFQRSSEGSRASA